MYKLFAAAALLCAVSAVPVDVPTGSWDLIAKGLLTTELCVAFTDKDNGYIAGDANGVGPAILKTTDGGQTWNPCPAKFGIDILLLSCDAVDHTIVVSSIGGELYSDNDGATFNHSIGGGLSQSVRYLGNDGEGGKIFGTACGKKGVQGVGLSTDGGKFFKHFDANLFTIARYAAFPTEKIWYVSAGTFPQNQPDDDFNNDDDFPPTGNGVRRTVFQDENGRFVTHPLRAVSNTTGNYQAQLAKTTDGGQTWTTLFAQNNTFYFNAIDCNPTDPNHCCVAAESADGAYAGARIMCTRDGANFNTTFNAPASSGESYSLIDLKFVNETFAWAAGGDLTSVAPRAWFLSTNDGGQTWQHTTKELFGYYATALSVLSGDLAYAAVDDLITQQSGVARYTA